MSQLELDKNSIKRRQVIETEDNFCHTSCSYSPSYGYFLERLYDLLEVLASDSLSGEIDFLNLAAFHLITILYIQLLISFLYTFFTLFIILCPKSSFCSFSKILTFEDIEKLNTVILPWPISLCAQTHFSERYSSRKYIGQKPIIFICDHIFMFLTTFLSIVSWFLTLVWRLCRICFISGFINILIRLLTIFACVNCASPKITTKIAFPLFRRMEMSSRQYFIYIKCI